jgi:hypothetical protein
MGSMSCKCNKESDDGNNELNSEPFKNNKKPDNNNLDLSQEAAMNISNLPEENLYTYLI